MNPLLTIVLSTASAIAAAAAPTEPTNTQVSLQYKKTAEVIMTARQNGVDISGVLELRPDNELFIALVLQAYGMTRFQTAEYQAHAIREFGTAHFVACMETLNGVSD